MGCEAYHIRDHLTSPLLFNSLLQIAGDSRHGLSSVQENLDTDLGTITWLDSQIVLLLNRLSNYIYHLSQYAVLLTLNIAIITLAPWLTAEPSGSMSGND